MKKQPEKKEIPLGVKICAGTFFVFAGVALLFNLVLIIFITFGWFLYGGSFLTWTNLNVVFSIGLILLNFILAKKLLKANNLAKWIIITISIGVFVSTIFSFYLPHFIYSYLRLCQSILCQIISYIASFLVQFLMVFMGISHPFKGDLSLMLDVGKVIQSILYPIASIFSLVYLLFSKKAKEYFNQNNKK